MYSNCQSTGNGIHVTEANAAGFHHFCVSVTPSLTVKI